MNRKIKFRAWDKIHQEMFIPTTISLNEPFSVFGGKNKIMKKFLCKIGIHKWRWYSSNTPYTVIYKCKWCGKKKEDYQGI